MKHDYIDILHDRLSQHEMTEPSGLWQEIENSLDSRGTHKKKGLVASPSAIYKIVAGVAAAALVAIVIWTTLNDEKNNQPEWTSQDLSTNEQVAESRTSPTPIEQRTPSLKKEGNMKSPAHKQLASAHTSQSFPNESKRTMKPSSLEQSAGNLTNQPLAHSSTLTSTSHQAKEETTSITLKEQESSMPQKVEIEDMAQVTTDTLIEQVDTTIIIQYEPAPLLPQLFTVTEPANKKQRQLEFTLSYNGNLASVGSSSNLGLYDSQPGTFPGNTSPDPDDPQNQVIVNVDKKEQIVPVRIGIEAWYPIGEKWRIGSGLVYTRLTRKNTTTYIQLDKTTWSRKTETASYLGIPLEVSRFLWSSRRWALYASAGAMIEFNLKSRSCQETQTEVYNKKESRDKRPQFSAIAKLGLQYNVIDRIGLYLEPGASYYIHNGADDNIYMSHPFRFDINLGIKINLGK
ncbi:MAG: hypothetical protein IJG81_02025 [Muribaculaceae bacterium]|nr:hypothetical protein [Muribaculaceae bacterium]